MQGAAPSLHGCSVQWISFTTVFHSKGQGVPFSTPPHCNGQWAMGLHYYIATLQGGKGQSVSFSESSHCRG